MTLDDVKNEIKKYLYMEDDTMIDVMVASVIANRLKIGDPVWMLLVGASSSGKSQILRPLAMTDNKFIHKIDDITENTFLSGSTGKGKQDVSLLTTKIGHHGIISISDITVLFSRNSESRNAILSQFRMLYDGEMTKYVGTKNTPLHWNGYLGMLAGGTPSVYTNFEEVGDMGERFLCYRMKKYDENKATRLALERKTYGKDLDIKLSEIYSEYIREIVTKTENIPALSRETEDHIIEIAVFAEKIRTVNKVDKYTKEIEKIPIPAFPMRTALQISSIAKALMLMRGKDLDEKDINMLSWIGMSLANEEKREVLHLLSRFIEPATTPDIADYIGLDTRIIRNVLQNLASTKIVIRSGGESDGAVRELKWEINEDYVDYVRKTFDSEADTKPDGRSLTNEELEEVQDIF